MKTGIQKPDIQAPRKNSLFYYVGVLMLVLVSSIWLLTNLDLYMLWQDEAETVCVAQTILEEGIPKGTDGKNFFSQQEGREYGVNKEWKLHPWFQFYWVALFFAFFENSTFVARFPFALLGIGTILFSFFLAKRLWKDNSTAWFVALSFLVNIMFLLLARQARYYTPVMFFSVYATWGLLDILERKKLGYWHYIIASLLFFQSQYLFAINFGIASFIYTAIFYKDRLKSLSLTIAFLAILCFPFLVWILDTPYGETLTSSASQRGGTYGIGRFSKAFFDYIMEPLWLLALIPLFFLKDSLNKVLQATKETEQIVVFFVLLIVGNIIAISLLVPEYYLRYLCVTIPFGLLIKGRIAAYIAQLHWLVPLVLIGGIVLYKGDIKNYVIELQEDTFAGPIEGMVSFLEKEGTSADKIAISFGDLPLKFYLENRIYGGLAGDLPENLDEMDFIIIRRNVIDEMDKPIQKRLHDYIQKNQTKFQAYKLAVEDSPFQNREIPYDHYYYKKVSTQNNLVVHKRKK